MQARLFSIWTLQLQVSFWNGCSMQFNIVERWEAFPEKDVSMGAYVVLKPVYIFQCWCLFIYFLPDVHAAPSVGTNGPPYHQRCRLLNWGLITSWLLFSQGRTRIHSCLKEFWISVCLTTGQFCTLPQSILNELLKMVVLEDHVYIWLFPCKNFNLHLLIARQTVFLTNNFCSQCDDFQCIPCTDWVLLEASGVTGIQH